MTQGFLAKSGTFEGPLDLLLELVEERKMLISDVSLSAVTDDFIAYISREDAYPAESTAQFLVIAATLLLIKSKALLPVLELSEDEQGDIKDLERRLAILSRVREAAHILSSRPRAYIAPGITVRSPLFVPAPDLSLDALSAHAHAAIAAFPKSIRRPEVAIAPVMSLDEMIESLTSRIERAIKLSFTDVTRGAQSAKEVVVSFLALLELVRLGKARAEQGTHFDEITIEYAGDLNAPRYD